VPARLQLAVKTGRYDRRLEYCESYGEDLRTVLCPAAAPASGTITASGHPNPGRIVGAVGTAAWVRYERVFSGNDSRRVRIHEALLAPVLWP